MSLELIIQALVNLGLSRLEAEVYTLVANKGAQKAVWITQALNINKSTTYSNLKKLQNKQLVVKDNARYYALPFEEALDLLIKKKKERAQVLHEKKEELLATWKKEP